MNRVEFRPSAEADLAAIAVYIAQSGPDRAYALLRRLRRRTEILATHPMAGRAWPELGDDMRSLAERPYLLVYRIVGDVSEVVAVLHGARDLPAAMRKRFLED